MWFLLFFFSMHCLQSHPAFTEYQDLLEDLEEKLSSVANVEEKWKVNIDFTSALWSSLVWFPAKVACLGRFHLSPHDSLMDYVNTKWTMHPFPWIWLLGVTRKLHSCAGLFTMMMILVTPFYDANSLKSGIVHVDRG